MAKTGNASVRQQEIIEALAVVMSKHGYDGATIQLIAQEAGLTPGLIHYHFRSKLEILEALLASIKDSVALRFKSRLKASSNPDAALAAFIDAHLSLGSDAKPHYVSCWNVIGAEAVREAQIRRAYQSVCRKQLEILTDLIKDCLAKEGRSKKAKNAIALATYSAIEGAYRLLIAAPDLIEPGFAAPTILSMTLAAIKAQPKS